MNVFIVLVFCLLTFARVPAHWSYITEVTERHEFYDNHEPIIKPQETWQTLFALNYIDANLRKLKDCVFFRVPGDVPGILKISTIPSDIKCEDKLLAPGEQELVGIRSLHFAVSPKDVSIDFSTSDLKILKWTAEIQEAFQRPTPGLNLSSAAYKSPSIILLAPESTLTGSQSDFLPEKTLCHDVNDECQENSPSQCSRCASGWYEIPNGCAQGPKYCGVHTCGLKGSYACRRGMRWQRSDSKFDCQVDSSFAYCAKGSILVCEGKRAWCR